ncbi:MAG TPA: hypothetical protein VEX38_09865, partial [Fimbriimonadaceae bacterium]|nr:hypothetical protein [Fimbriimonadaceae bacterium]
QLVGRVQGYAFCFHKWLCCEETLGAGFVRAMSDGEKGTFSRPYAYHGCLPSGTKETVRYEEELVANYVMKKFLRNRSDALVHGAMLAEYFESRCRRTLAFPTARSFKRNHCTVYIELEDDESQRLADYVTKRGFRVTRYSATDVHEEYRFGASLSGGLRFAFTGAHTKWDVEMLVGTLYEFTLSGGAN